MSAAATKPVEAAPAPITAAQRDLLSELHQEAFRAIGEAERFAQFVERVASRVMRCGGTQITLAGLGEASRLFGLAHNQLAEARNLAERLAHVGRAVTTGKPSPAVTENDIPF